MTTLNHRNRRAANNHSLYQTDLHTSTNSLLSAIKENTANINLNVDTLEVNTDGLETLITSTNSKLDTKLPSALTGSGNLKVCLQELGNEGSERLNVDVGSTVLQLPSALTGEGNLKVSIQEDHTHDLSTAANQVLHNTKLDTIDGSINTIEACVGSNKVNVNISSGTIPLPSGAATEAKQDVLETTLTAIETDAAAIEVLLTGIDADTDSVKTSALALSGAVDGSYLNVNANIQGTDVDSNSGNKSAASQRVVIATDDINMAAIKTATEASATDLAALEILQTATNSALGTIDTVLDNIKVDTEAIETAVESMAEAVKAEDSAHSSGDKGFMLLGVRQDSQADFGADGDYVPFSIDADGKLRVAAAAASGGATEAKQDVLETTLTAIETSVQALDNAVDGNYLNVNANIAGTDVDSNSGNKSAATQRVVIATDDVNISAIKTAVELIDNAISGSEMQVDVVAALPAGNNNIGNVDIASAIPAGTNAIGKLAANSGVDIGDVDVTSISAGTNRIGMVALKANENVGGTGTERHLLCDSAGHLQVDVVSAPSTTVTGTVTANLSATDNAVLDTIDAVLDNIKVDTEAIETAVEALNARDSLTTTLIIDGQTVSSSGNHTSSSFEVTNINRSGKLQFLVRISGVSVPDISVAVQLSADNTNFFGADLSMITQGVSTSGDAQFITCNFAARYIKIKLTNSNGSSAATCSVHMFN